MVRPAEAPRRPVEGTPIQFETIRRDYSPPVTRARNRLRSQRTRVSTQPVTEVIRNRAVSRQIYHNMHIVRTPNNIEHNSMVLRSHVAHMDQQDAMRQTLPTDGTQPRRKAKPRGIFTNAQKRRAQQSQCPVGSFNDRNLHLRPSLLNLAQGPQPGPSTVPARDERRNAHTMVTRTQSGGYWRPDLSAHSSSSSIDDTTTGTQNTAKRQGAASQQKDGNMLTSNIKTEVRTLAEKRRAMLARKMNASKSSGCSSKDSEKEGSTSLPLERDTPSHSSHSRSDQSSEGTPSHSSSDQSSEGTPSHSSHSSRDQSSVVTTHTSSESDIDFSVLHRPSDLSLSELPEHGPVRGKPNTSRWFKSLGKGPRPWSSSSESTNEDKASSEESFRSISTVASNSSHKSNDLNLPFDNANNHSLSISKTEENNTDIEESTSGVQTECRDTMVGDKSNTDLQTGSQGPALNDTNARLQTGNNSIVASSTVAGGNKQDMRAPVINQNTQATDAASFVRSQSMKRKDFEDMLVHDTRNETKKKKIDIKWKRPPPYFQHLNKELARSEISSDGREDKSVDNIRAGIYGDMRKKEDDKNRKNTAENNTAKDGDTTDNMNAEVRENNTAKNGDTWTEEYAAKSRANIFENNTVIERNMRNEINAASSNDRWVNNTAIDEVKHVMKSRSDEGWVYINLDNSITIHESSREKSVGDVIQEMLNQSRIKAFANWKDAKNRNRTRANNKAKEGIMRDKEEAKSRDNLSVNNAANRDIMNDVNAGGRENILANNSAKYVDLRHKEDANVFVNNTAIDEDKHVMKSKSDEGWVYINLDNSITIHESSREKSVGDVIQEMLNQSRINAFANWKDAKNRNRTRAYNTAKGGIMRDKEEAESRDNFSVSNTANGDIRNDVNAEIREHMWVNNTAKYGELRDEDALSTDNILVNNTSMDEDKHVMKSKSDLGWEYINLDKRITIHESSREKSVGEVIQEMLNQSRIKAFANWKDAKDRNRTRAYNTAKDEIMRDKEEVECRDNVKVNNTANGDTRNDVNAESRDNIRINSTAQNEATREKDDAEISNNIFVNNTAMDEDNHAMKSKSDEGWVYINLDNSITIHKSSREKSVGEVIQEMLNQSRIKAFANWKDARNRNRTWVYNTAKDGNMRDKENTEDPDNFSVSNTANGDIRNDVNAEIREHMWVNNTAKYGELRDKEDALSTDNILVNNTSMDEDKHVMKSKSDLGWEYINLDKRITIHESSREKSVGEVIQEMLNQSRIKAFANWKDAKDRNRTRAYNTAKDEIMRDKEEVECRDNIKVNNTANGDIRNDVNAESRDNIRINSTAQNEATREKDDAEISNNIFVNNTAMDEDNHAMKSKSDEGWVYINLDNSITIHESSREKSVGEVIQEMLNQSRIKAFANWKDARNRNRTWVYNTAKDGNMRDKENTEDPDNLLVNNIADRDMKIEVNAERRDNIWINNTAKYGDMRKKEDATSSDNTFENNAALGEDKHVMKSKSDEGWVYINLDKSIGIHTSSPEKSVGEVIQEMLNQSRMNRLPNREASVPSYSLESQSRKRKLDFNISSQTKKKKMDIKWEQPQTNIQHSAMELTAVESRIHVDLPSTSTMIYPEQVAKEVEEGIDMAPSKTGMTYNTRSAVKRKRGFEKDVGEGKDWDGKRRRC